MSFGGWKCPIATQLCCTNQCSLTSDMLHLRSRTGSLVITGQLGDNVSLPSPASLEKLMATGDLGLFLSGECEFMVLGGLNVEPVHYQLCKSILHPAAPLLLGTQPPAPGRWGGSYMLHTSAPVHRRGGRAIGRVCLFLKLPSNGVTVANEGLWS